MTKSKQIAHWVPFNFYCFINVLSDFLLSLELAVYLLEYGRYHWMVGSLNAIQSYCWNSLLKSLLSKMFFHECKQQGWPFSLIFIDSHSARIYFTSAPRDFSDTKHIYTPENWIRIHGKNGTHRIILAVYKDNNIGRRKSGLRTKFARLRLHHTFWTLDRHLIWDYGTAHASSKLLRRLT